MNDAEPELIIEDWSPVSDIQAFVERSEKNYYFYFWINPESEEAEIRSCWICNRVKAPADIQEAMAVEGEAPCMPAEYVDHDPDGIDLDEDSLSIEWFEEGNAAALLSGDRIIAVIPNFSGYNGFHGYSIYAKGTGSLLNDVLACGLPLEGPDIFRPRAYHTVQEYKRYRLYPVSE